MFFIHAMMCFILVVLATNVENLVFPPCVRWGSVLGLVNSGEILSALNSSLDFKENSKKKN